MPDLVEYSAILVNEILLCNNYTGSEKKVRNVIKEKNKNRNKTKQFSAYKGKTHALFPTHFV